MDELATELAGAVERAEEEGRRSRFLGEIAGSIDMDEVLARTLEAGTRMEGVDAALIRLESAGGRPDDRRPRPVGRRGRGDRRPAGRVARTRDRGQLSLSRGRPERGGPDCRRSRRPARGQRQQDRLPRGLHAEPRPALRGGRRAPPRGADAAGDAGDRERPALPRGAAARRSRRADRAAQPAVLPRDPRARMRARIATTGGSR